MKLKLLTLLVGAAIVAPSAMADVTVYGKLNASVENVENAAGDDAWEVQSNASRFGVKGNAELTESLQAVYKLEWQVDVADASSTKTKVDCEADTDGVISCNSKTSENLKSRNQYVGLKGGFGQVILGRHDSPLKSSQGNVDLFGDIDGDIGAIMYGENRLSNLIMYSSPKIGDMVTLNLALQPGEEKGGENDGIADAISASAVFEMNGIYAALAVDNDVNGMDIVRVTAQYNAEMFGVGSIYQTAEIADVNNSDEDSLFVSAYFKIGDGQIEAQYGVTDADASDDDLAQFSIGYEYNLGKKTKAYSFVTNTDNDQDDWTTFGIGLEHSF